VTDEVGARISGSARLVFFDGTLWRDDEMIRQRPRARRPARAWDTSMSGGRRHRALARKLSGSSGKIFLHINNSNPALMPGSPERRTAEQGRLADPADGMEIVL
jgi:pyrroloquinoline quinone biosynthesis protein B